SAALPFFPDTTLFRSTIAAEHDGGVIHLHECQCGVVFVVPGRKYAANRELAHTRGEARRRDAALRGQQHQRIARPYPQAGGQVRSEEHTSELQSRENL